MNPGSALSEVLEEERNRQEFRRLLVAKRGDGTTVLRPEVLEFLKSRLSNYIESEEDLKQLSPVYTTRYRSLTMRINYLAQDRSDLQFSGKELARAMQMPTQGDWAKLKVLIVYLANFLREIERRLWQSRNILDFSF